MGNAYGSNQFTIGDDTDLDGLTALKGGAPAKTDEIYVFSGAVLTITGDIDCKLMKVGVDTGGASSTASVIILAGAALGFATGNGDGLYIDALGDFTMTGSTGSQCVMTRASGESDYFGLQQMDGGFHVQDAYIDYLDYIAPVDATFELTRVSMTVLFSATTILTVSGPLAIASSEITSYGNRWALAIYGDATMDIFSVLKNARMCMACSTQTLVFDDDPDDIGEDNTPIVSINPPLGGSKSRGKNVGLQGRKIAVTGSFKTENSGTDRLVTHFLKMKYMAQLKDTFSLTWDEGVISKCLITKFSYKRTPDNVQERFYSFEIQEIY